MRCAEFERDLVEARESQPDGGRAELAEHALACPRCAAVMHAEGLATRELARLRVTLPEVPPGFGASVRRRLERAATKQPLFGPLTVGAGLVAAAACLVVVRGLVLRLGPPAGPSQMVASATAPDAPAGPDATRRATSPVIWSNGEVDVEAGAVVQRPAAAPRKEQDLAVLVEYHL